MAKERVVLRFHLEERAKERLVVAVAGLLVGALCLGGILIPTVKDIVRLRDKITKDRQRIDLLREVKALEKKVSELETPLAVWTDRSLLMGKIADVADKSRVTVQNLVPRTIREGAYVRLSVEVQAEGAFFDQLRFLKALEAIEPPVRVRELSLTRNKTQAAVRGSAVRVANVRAKVVIEGYLKQPPRKKRT